MPVQLNYTSKSQPPLLEMMDETTCSVLCQHPMCWASNRRLERKLPRKRVLSAPPAEEEDDGGLPTMKVNNMLEDYGEDPSDRYPASWSGLELHQRAKPRGSLPALERRESFPKTKTPHASPITSQHFGRAEKRVPQIKRVEVQEVFEKEDLEAPWTDTFMTKQYYVWVPNPKKKKKQRKSVSEEEDPLHGLSFYQMYSRAPVTVPPKDVTEEMVPKEIEMQRETETAFDEVWPVWKVRKHASSRRDVKSPTESQYLRNRSPSPPRKTKTDAELLMDLLNLPTEVLRKVLNDEEARRLLSKEKIRDLLLSLVPTLPRDKTSLALAQSGVLRQSKVNLRDSRDKVYDPEKYTVRQVFHLDDDSLIERMSLVNAPERPRSEQDDDRLANMSDFGSVRETHSARADSPKYIKKPLPSLGGTPYTYSAGGTRHTKLPSISLGLPEIPPGRVTTRPFTYKNKEWNFALGRIPTPPTSEMEGHESRLSQITEDRGSTIHVTMPSVDSTVESPTEQYRGAKESETTETEDEPPPMHRVSPLNSTHVPKTPAATPAATVTPQTPQASLTAPNGGWPGGYTPAQETPEGFRSLGTIPEGIEQKKVIVTTPTATTAPHKTVIDQKSPRLSSKRSVRFAPEVKSPSVQETSVATSPPSSGQSRTSTVGSPREYSPQPPSTTQPSSLTSLVVVGAKTVKTDETGSQPGVIVIPTSVPQAEHPMSPTGSSEVWPEVNEDDYNRSPTPPTEHTPISKPNSMAANYDSKSERSALTSMVKSGSRGSTADSIVARKILSGKHTENVDSPAPPPPSPEPQDSQENESSRVLSGYTHKDSLSMAPVDEENQSEDGSISVLPPNNLDDISAVPSPVHQVKGLVAKPSIDEDDETMTVTVDENSVTVQSDVNKPPEFQALTDEEKIAKAKHSEPVQDDSGTGSFMVKGTQLTGVRSPDPISEIARVNTDLGAVDSNIDQTNTKTEEAVKNSDNLKDKLQPDQEPVSVKDNKADENVPVSVPIENEQDKHVISGSENQSEQVQTESNQCTAGILTGEPGQSTSNQTEFEITENGGDHEGFKDELREELARLSLNEDPNT